MAQNDEQPKPFSYSRFGELWQILDEKGRQIAVLRTAVDARFLVVSANHFDRLYAMLKLCRGEFESNSLPVQRPAYNELLRVAEAIETDLRSQPKP